MTNRSLYFPPVVVPEQMPSPLPLPKFQIGQQVQWAYVEAKDFGTIVGMAYSSEASTQGLGYHYAIQLSPSSSSYSDGITSDWAFEDDIELYSQADREDAIG
ncbi:hypothetical protein H6F67_12495 [Microcoleus sp. FACHB-1515]|uniref:hypothetical protein n=1 Tax=Cyanophyceae TaxID=3028117 RepID=UPI001688C965|nr:hypothetical protein [Microcoleus sp. FACHB-1515]MBD2090673.1 hypothetical protein [Microcoleus sp. FACHB-1515]